MGFWIFMFIVTLLIPISLIIIWYTCPRFKNINNASGYRTSRSMKNQETWDFSQKYCAGISLCMFFPTVVLAVAIMPFFINESIGKIGFAGLAVTIIQMVSFAVIIIFTERELKKNFDEHGNRR